MKKLAIALSAALVFALAAPAAAATNVSLSGSLSQTIDVTGNIKDKTVEVTPTTDLGLELNLGLESGQKIKGVIEFAPISWTAIDSDVNDDGTVDNELGGNTPTTPEFMKGLVIDRAYIQTTGALYDGGQEITTTLGDFDAEFSPYVLATNWANDGSAPGFEGVKVEGIKLGPVSVAGMWGRSAAESDTLGATASANVEGVEVSGTIVSADDKAQVAYAVGAKATPVQNVTLEGTYAGIVGSQDSAVKVDATVGVIPNVTLKGGFWKFDNGFDPIYRDRSVDDDGNLVSVVDTHKDQLGVSAEVATAYKGVDLKGSVKQYGAASAGSISDAREIGLEASTNYQGIALSASHTIDQDLVAKTNTTATTFGAEKDFAVAQNLVIKGSANLGLENGEFDYAKVAASTKTDLAVFKGVELGAQYVYGDFAAVDADEDGFGAFAKYTAPNGLAFELAAYDSGNFEASTGISVEF